MSTNLVSYNLGAGGQGSSAVAKRPVQAPLLVEKLSSAEERELYELESCVRAAVDSQVEAAKALARIRDKRLYRAEFKTFEAYCDARWKMTGRRARQLSDFFLMRKNLEERTPEYDLADSAATGERRAEDSPPYQSPLPENERVVRKLASRPPKEQREVWREAVKAADGKQPTAKHVEQVLARIASPVLEQR